MRYDPRYDAPFASAVWHASVAEVELKRLELWLELCGFLPRDAVAPTSLTRLFAVLDACVKTVRSEVGLGIARHAVSSNPGPSSVYVADYRGIFTEGTDAPLQNAVSICMRAIDNLHISTARLMPPGFDVDGRAAAAIEGFRVSVAAIGEAIRERKGVRS